MWGFAFLKNGFTLDLAGTILVGIVLVLRASEFLFLQPSDVRLVREGVIRIRLADA